MKILFNKYYFSLLFINLNILYFVPLFSIIFKFLNPLFLVWGMMILLNDFISKKAKVYLMIDRLLLLFVLSYAISIVLNIPSSFIFGTMNIAYLVISFYIIKNSLIESVNYKVHFSNFSMVFVSIITLFSIISIYFYFNNVSFVLNDFYRQGMHDNRAFGLFTSPNVSSMLSYLSIILLVANGLINRHSINNFLKKNILNLIIILINVFNIYISNSRATLISFYVLIILSIIMLLVRKIITVKFFLGSVAILLLFTNAVPFNSNIQIDSRNSKTVEKTIEKTVEKAVEKTVEKTVGNDDEVLNNKSTMEPLSQDRELRLNNLLDNTSGRTKIWLRSMKFLQSKPFFGLSTTRILEKETIDEILLQYKFVETDDVFKIKELNGYLHNGYIQTAVYSGFIGVTIFLLFLIVFLKRIFLRIYYIKSNQSLSLIFLTITIITLLLHDLFETNIIFNNRDVIGSMFWFLISFIYKHLETVEREHKKNAFIVWTPLHIINVLNTYINYYLDTDSDLFIYGEFANAEVYYDRIKELNIFTNVYFIDHRKMGNKLIRNINVLFNRNQMLRELKYYNYSDIFTQGGNHFLKILYGKTKLRNSSVKLHYIEDGIVSYTNFDKLRIMNIKSKRNLILNIVNPYSIMSADFKSVFLYEPKYSSGFNSTIIKLPKIVLKSRIINLLIEIFELPSHKCVIKDKLIYLQQPLEEAGYIIDEKHVVDRIIANSVRPLLVKMHPRGNDEKFTNYLKLDTTLPWELCLLNYSFVNTDVVSIASTATLTTSFMFEFNSSITYYLLSDAVINDKLLKNKFLNFKQITEIAKSVKSESIVVPETISDFFTRKGKFND